VLVGIILVVRYDALMAALLPMAGIATALQVPAFYFVDGLAYPPLLLIPSGAPTMLIRGAFVPLQAWEWAYAVGVTAVSLVVLVRWSLRAFEVHVIRRAG
jgi:fluoroquinolone transport system permease protein